MKYKFKSLTNQSGISQNFENHGKNALTQRQQYPVIFPKQTIVEIETV